MSLYAAVSGALAHVRTDPSDAATTELARTYAREIDAGGDLERLGPKLLDCLESLGMSPRARKSTMKAGENVGSPLDELRKRRAERARVDGPSAVDATPS